MRPRLADLLARPPWMDDGICGPEDTDLLYSVDSTEWWRGRQLCSMCPVRVECADYALENNEPDGIWGGLDPAQRRSIRRRTQGRSA